MKDSEFIEVSDLLKNQEKRIITPASLERIAESGGFLESAVMLTQNSDYDFSKVTNMIEATAVLDEGVRTLYEFVRSVSPHQIVVEALASHYDYNNLKAALYTSYIYPDTPPHYILASSIPEEEFNAFADPKNDLFESSLPSHLLNNGINARAVFQETGSISLTNTFLDRKKFRWMLSLAEQMDNDFITHYIETSIDFYNISAIIRHRSVKRETTFLEPFLISGGRTPTENILYNYSRPAPLVFPAYYHKYYGSALLSVMDSWEKKASMSELSIIFHQLLYALLINTKYISYGIEIVFSYLLWREREIQQILWLLQNKYKGTDPKKIKDFLENPFMKR